MPGIGYGYGYGYALRRPHHAGLSCMLTPSSLSKISRKRSNEQDGLAAVGDHAGAITILSKVTNTNSVPSPILLQHSSCVA
jgi:hypothetical protein